MKQVKSIAVLWCLILAGCGAAGQHSPVKKNDVAVAVETGWALREIKTPETVVALERPPMDLAGMGDFYTMRFDGEKRIVGKTSSSYFAASCVLGEDSSISLGPIATARTAAPRELLLKEEDFFQCLEQVNTWAIVPEGEMIFYSSGTGTNRWVILTFEKYLGTHQEWTTGPALGL